MVRATTESTIPQKEGLQEVEQELHAVETKQYSLQALVYISLFAFVILAAYGFYLIQTLTTDVHRLTSTIIDMQKTFVAMQENVKTDLDSMVISIDSVSTNVSRMTLATTQMSHHMTGMNNSTDRMATDVQQMNASTQNMAVSMYNLQGDMGNMNRTFSSPFKMMSNFMPFGGGNKRQYVPTPPVTYYPQQGYYPAWPYNTVQMPLGVGSAPPVETSITPTPTVTTPAPPLMLNGKPPVSAPVISPEGQSHSNPREAERLANS